MPMLILIFFMACLAAFLEMVARVPLDGRADLPWHD